MQHSYFKLGWVVLVVALGLQCGTACSANDSATKSTAAGGTSGAGGNDAGNLLCGACTGSVYIPCDNGVPGDQIICPAACSTSIGCTTCRAGTKTCVGAEVHECDGQGNPGGVVETCDTAAGLTCSGGECKTACEAAADTPSNIGCEFWAVDLDQQDGFNDPANMPWGVALANAGSDVVQVTIEGNTAPVGDPLTLVSAAQVTVMPGSLEPVVLPTRELDCGTKPNDYNSPGTCLSSRAFRIKSTAPIVVYQFNTFQNAFSNDASLLLPTTALGRTYRVLGWPAGHAVKGLPIPVPIDRAYVTVVGTTPGTTVKVRPSWRIVGNGPIAATAPGGSVDVTLGPFDVLNLETDAATVAESMQGKAADLTGSVVEASAPVAVFSGVESTPVPYNLQIPEPPGGADTCCLDHLEEQLLPLESIGTKFVVTRSPVRSTGSFVEPDVLRFVGGAEAAEVTTTLPSPFDKFTIQPGEVRDTWTDKDIIVTSTKPVLVGQLLVSQGYVDGAYKGDPSLTIFPPFEQFRSEYVFLTPPSWSENWVVVAAEEGAVFTIDGMPPAGCIVAGIGTLEGKQYQAHRCPIGVGSHKLSADRSVGITGYGYGAAGSYAYAGGADVKRIYVPPPIP